MEHGKVATAEGKVVQQIPVRQQESCLEGNKEGSRSDNNTRKEYAKQNFAEQGKTQHLRNKQSIRQEPDHSLEQGTLKFRFKS